MDIHLPSCKHISFQFLFRNLLRIQFISCAFLSVLLQGCASSDVSRNTTNGFQGAYQGASTALSGEGDSSLAQSYGNSTQATKGALIGGATGAVAGGMTTGIGVVPGAAGGAIFGGAIGAYIDSKTTPEDKLINRGCNVVVLGDHIMIVMPARYLFRDSTSDFVTYAYSTMDLVVKLVNRYPNMSVKVSAFRNTEDSDQVNLSLSQDQANNIVRYLFRAGLNTRLVYGSGYGATRPILNPLLGDKSRDNDRIEITLEKLPV